MFGLFFCYAKKDLSFMLKFIVNRLPNTLGSSAQSFTPLKSFVPPNKTLKCCPECSQSYERELSEIETLSQEVKTEIGQPKQLPQWLLSVKPVSLLSMI